MASASYGASHAHRVGYGDVGEDEDEGFMPAVLGSSLSSQRSGSYNMRLRSTSPADAELGLYASAGSGGGRRSTRNRDRISSEDSAASATRATYRATHSAGHAPRVRRARTASITSQSTRNTVDGDDDDGDGDEDEDDEVIQTKAWCGASCGTSCGQSNGDGLTCVDLLLRTRMGLTSPACAGVDPMALKCAASLF